MFGLSTYRQRNARVAHGVQDVCERNFRQHATKQSLRPEAAVAVATGGEAAAGHNTRHGTDTGTGTATGSKPNQKLKERATQKHAPTHPCLLYTSDAADE